MKSAVITVLAFVLIPIFTWRFSMNFFGTMLGADQDMSERLSECVMVFGFLIYCVIVWRAFDWGDDHPVGLALVYFLAVPAGFALLGLFLLIMYGVSTPEGAVYTSSGIVGGYALFLLSLFML